MQNTLQRKSLMDINIDPKAWLESLWQDILELGRTGFGDSTMRNAKRLANDSLFSLNAEHWQVWAVAFGVALFIATFIIAAGGARIGLAGADIEKVRKGKASIKQAGQTFIAGLAIPTMLVVLLIAVDLLRKLALSMAAPPKYGGTWYQVYSDLLIPIAGPGEFVGNLVWGGITNWLIDLEFSTLGTMVGLFSVLILVTFPFKGSRWGARMVRLLIGIVLGLSTALPFQVAILAGSTRVADPTFTTALLATSFAALIPIALIIIWTMMDPYAKLSGGSTSIDEGNLETTSGDEPVPVVVQNDEIAVDASASQPLDINLAVTKATSTQPEHDASMAPQVDGVEGEGNLVRRRRARDTALDVSLIVAEAAPAIGKVVAPATGPYGQAALLAVSVGGKVVSTARKRSAEKTDQSADITPPESNI